MVKVHMIDDALGAGTKVTTYCGLVGWRLTSDEYETAQGRVFDVVGSAQTATCKRCIAIAKTRPASDR